MVVRLENPVPRERDRQPVLAARADSTRSTTPRVATRAARSLIPGCGHPNTDCDLCTRLDTPRDPHIQPAHRHVVEHSVDVQRFAHRIDAPDGHRERLVDAGLPAALAIGKIRHARNLTRRRNQCATKGGLPTPRAGSRAVRDVGKELTRRVMESGEQEGPRTRAFLHRATIGQLSRGRGLVVVGVLAVQNACRDPAVRDRRRSSRRELRIRSTGLAQVTGSAGVNRSLIRKSPSGVDQDTSTARCVVQNKRGAASTNQRGHHAESRPERSRCYCRRPATGPCP